MSFDVLVKRLTPKLKGITHRLNGHFTYFNDDDLYQEALTHLWVDFKKGVLTDKTDSYILQGCYYYLKNYIRKSLDNVAMLSLNSSACEDGTTIEETLFSEDDNFIDYLDTKLCVETIGSEELTERERGILAYLLEGMSMREIGKKLGISHVMVLKIRNTIKNKYERLYPSAKNRHLH